jgi:hypothetical protein
MAITTGKIVEILFEKSLETFETQDMLLPLVDFNEPEQGMMQKAGDVIWRPVQQHAPIISGWDLTGTEQTIIEETVPSILGTPKNDWVQVRADDMRTESFWNNRAVESGRRQASELNQTIASAIALQGSKFYRSNVTSGYDFIAEAGTLLNETQQKNNGRAFILNDRDNLKYSKDLAGRQTVQGRPEQVWSTGQVGQNIASFDVYTGSFLPALVGGADPATTVTGNQSFVPEAGSVNTSTGVVTNVDYRIATIAVAASASYNIGDKITFANSSTTVKSVGLDDKTVTGQAMTFTIVAKPSGTSISVYPKPIAADDPALTTLQKAYANINTRILNNATVNRVNIDASARTNLFFDKSAIEVLGGDIPANLFSEFKAAKVVSKRMKNGLTMYMLYDGNITTMNFRYRLFTWYGVTVLNPQNCGVAVSY